MNDLFNNNNGAIQLEFCNCYEKNDMFRRIINDHHEYMNYKDTCNRRLNWLIYENVSGNLIGSIGINSAILALGKRDKVIGWDRSRKNHNINMIANNYRFALIKKNIMIENAGSQVLKALRLRAPILWKARYGDDLLMLESLVKPPWTGSVYKADNWLCIGKTKGFSFSKAPLKSWEKESGRRGFMARHYPKESIAQYAIGKRILEVTRTEPKLIFIKPLVRSWKARLND